MNKTVLWVCLPVVDGFGTSGVSSSSSVYIRLDNIVAIKENGPDTSIVVIEDGYYEVATSAVKVMRLIEAMYRGEDGATPEKPADKMHHPSEELDWTGKQRAFPHRQLVISGELVIEGGDTLTIDLAADPLQGYKWFVHGTKRKNGTWNYDEDDRFEVKETE